MSDSPSADLCYGVSLMTDGEEASIPEDKLCELMDKDLGEFEIYSCGDHNNWLGHVLAIKHKENYFEYSNELGKYLPETDPTWDAKLKAFCKENDIPFVDPRWWLLASYS